jgi:hypothetical protein
MCVSPLPRTTRTQYMHSIVLSFTHARHVPHYVVCMCVKRVTINKCVCVWGCVSDEKCIRADLEASRGTVLIRFCLPDLFIEYAGNCVSLRVRLRRGPD